MAPGETLTFLNLDLVSHDVTSEGTFRPKPRKRPGRKPKPRPPQLLFRSDLIGFGQQTTVTGTHRLKPGVSYPYFCSLHPSMTGVVTVG
jgi:plastocyanin